MEKHYSVWVVDDDEVNRFLYERFLTNEFDILNVRYFVNGDDAKAELLTMKQGERVFPDIIFLDREMPVMNGWEFLDWFKTLSPDIRRFTKIIMATSFLTKSDRVKAARYPCLDKCVLKPINRDMLKLALSNCIN